MSAAMPSLAVVGAGGHGRVVADAADLLGWDVVFFDDRAAEVLPEWPVIGRVDQLIEQPGQVDGAIVAIGNNRVRLDLTRRLLSIGMTLPAIIHPAAVVSSRAQLGFGVFLAASARVGIGANLGTASIINTGANADHDCTLSDGVHLSPGVILSGSVTIGECSWIGTGSCVRNNIMIGANTVVGVGSAVVSDLPDNVIAYGTPARMVRSWTAEA